MKVLRIEHMGVLRDGRPAGPYNDSVFWVEEHLGVEHLGDYRVCEDGDCIHYFVNQIAWVTDERTPTPRDDGIDDFDEGDLFCFRTVDQMRNWFSGVMHKLSDFGFVAAVYEVPDWRAWHGGRQSVFTWDCAIRIGDAGVFDYSALATLMA